MTTDARARLREEARVFTRYLLDRDCPEELAERYEGACVARSLADDDAVTAFVRWHAETLPFIDAAAALAGRADGLRARLQVMAAVLEASPHYADEFLDAPRSRTAAFLVLAGHGVASAGKAAIGLPLLIALESDTT